MRPCKPCKPRKLATLDPIENQAWIEYFLYAKETLKYGDLRADAYAWRRMVEDYPRLKAFDGARPGVSIGKVSL